MRQKLKDIFRGPVVFYPLVFAAFPVLFLYAHNIGQTSASEIWLPIGVSVAAAVVLWVVLSLALASVAKAAFATAIFQVFFFSYGRLYDVLAHRGLVLANHGYLLPATLFIWGCCVYFISRTKRDFRITTRMLNIAAVVLIAINLFNVANYQVRLTASNSGPQDEPTASQPEHSALPDIYFIIMDEYAHPDTMLEWFEYDNNEFVHGLEDEGFFIADDSQTPSGHTVYVLAGVLNLEYPGHELAASELYKMVAYNGAAEFLRARGYEFTYFGNVYDFGRWYTHMKDSADHYFNYFEGSATPWISEFQEILWNTTMLKPFYYQLVGSQYEEAQRRQVLYTLEHLKTVPRVEGPKFVVTHLYCPHVPFVFGPEGEYISAANWQNYEDRQFYLGQYIFISTEMERLVNVLLEESEIPPIIIIQSDHGLRQHDSDIVGPQEWHKILNAMCLPGMDYGELRDSMSPVNTFRIVFNHYFDADYALLDDD
ncbi:MAG: hypothetical protein R6U93_08240 [Dehalococcoidia bacterium]